MQARSLENPTSLAMAAGPEAILELLQNSLKEDPGFDLFTVLAARPGARFLERIYSTNEAQYPLGQADEIEDTIWFRRLFADKQPIVANTIDEIGHWIADFQIFIEQGYGSLVNMPVVFEGETLGLINIMAASNRFDNAAVRTIVQQIPLAALALMARRRTC